MRRDACVQSLLVGRLHDRRAHLRGLAVAGPDHGGLADGAAPGPEFLGGVLVVLLAAEIGLVDFDRAGTRVRPFGPRLAQAMGQVPSRGLADAEVAMEFHARDAFEAGREQVDGHGPGAVTELGALQQGAGLGREVLAALAAAVRLGLACGPGLDVGGAAGRAADAVGPEDVREPALGTVLVGEQVHQLDQGDALAMGSAGASLRNDPPTAPSVAKLG